MIAEKGFDHILGFIKEGVSEREIALELDFFMLKNGAEAISFETIAVSGKNSSMPHGVPRPVKLEKGFLTEAIINYIALLGWSPKGNEEKLSMDELKQMFGVEGISKSQSIFDEQKLRWLNGRYIKELDFDKFVEMLKNFNGNEKIFKEKRRKKC